MTLRRKRQNSTSKPAGAEADKAQVDRPRKVRTPYHPIAYTLIQCALPGQWQAIPEHLLHHEPQRVDILVILKKSVEEENPIVGQLPSLVARLGTQATVLEFKGPTDTVVAQDLTTVLGYGMQLAVQKGFKPQDVSLGVLVSKVSRGFKDRMREHGGQLEQSAPGVWDGMAGGFRVFALELSKVWQREEAERLWYTLTPEFRRNDRPMKELSNVQSMIFYRMYEQLRQTPGIGEHIMQQWASIREQFIEMNLKLATAHQVRQAFEREELMSQYTPEERLLGLRPEERLLGLRPEERVALMHFLQASSEKTDQSAS